MNWRQLDDSPGADIFDYLAEGRTYFWGTFAPEQTYRIRLVALRTINGYSYGVEVENKKRKGPEADVYLCPLSDPCEDQQQ